MISGEDRSVLGRSAGQPDAIVTYGPGAGQIADVYAARAAAAATPRPLLVLIHGGFWRPEYDRLHLRPMAEALAAAGWTVALPEYARVPGRPAATLADVALAAQQLPLLVQAHDGRIILAGHSAGGHLALWLAAAAGAGIQGGVLALAPVADLELADELGLDDGAVRAFLGAGPGVPPALDPRQMPFPAVPATLIHGDADTLVPLALTDSYAAAHPAARIVRLPGAGHFQLIDPMNTAWPTVVGELERLAGRLAPVA